MGWGEVGELVKKVWWPLTRGRFPLSCSLTWLRSPVYTRGASRGDTEALTTGWTQLSCVDPPRSGLLCCHPPCEHLEDTRPSSPRDNLLSGTLVSGGLQLTCSSTDPRPHRAFSLGQGACPWWDAQL